MCRDSASIEPPSERLMYQICQTTMPASTTSANRLTTATCLRRSRTVSSVSVMLLLVAAVEALDSSETFS